MAVDGETIVPEAGFLRYRYLSLAAWTTGGVLSMAWILPLARGEYFTPVWISFLAWTLSVLLCADVAVAWIPLHARSLRYMFEADRLVAHAGVWFRSKAFVPYFRITDVTVRQGPLERRFGLHRLFVQTAGSSLPEAILLGIGDPDRVRESLFRRKSAADTSSVAAPSPTSLLRDVRDELAEIKVLLETRPSQ